MEHGDPCRVVYRVMGVLQADTGAPSGGHGFEVLDLRQDSILDSGILAGNHVATHKSSLFLPTTWPCNWLLSTLNLPPLLSLGAAVVP